MPHPAPKTQEPKTLGGQLPHIIADVLTHSRTFLDALDQKRPLTIEGTVTDTQRDNTGANKVRIQRTGQPRADATWYVVWGAFQVPIAGDQVRLLLLGKGGAVILGAKHGGRPAEWTIPYTGGALHQYDAARNHIHLHTDAHDHLHYHTNGTTVTHHHHGASGHHTHTGNHRMGGGGGLTIASNGTPSGTWHEKTHANGRYEHSQSGVLVRHHHTSGDHGHYSAGTLIHNIVPVGTAGGAVKVKQHNSSNYHQMGDNGAGVLAHIHATGGNAWLTDGTQHLWYTNTGGAGNQLTMKHIALGTQAGQIQVQRNNTFGSYHTWGDNGSGAVQMAHGIGRAIMDHDGTTHNHYAGVGLAWSSGGTDHTWYINVGGNGIQPCMKHIAVGAQAGQLLLQRHNTFGAYHWAGDNGAGQMSTFSQIIGHQEYIYGGAYAHTRDQHWTIRPSGVYHSHPTTDSSILHHLTAGGGGALKRATHSTTPQVVGSGSATIGAGNVNVAAYSVPGGAAGDPHLKLLMGCVWDSGVITNPGFYYHAHAAVISNTGSAYSANVLNTAGGGVNTNYAWGTSALAHDSRVYIYATKIGAPANLTVGTALWQHIVN